MGYLQRIEGIPNFSKGLLSFWFRIPAESVAASHAQWLAAPIGTPPFPDGIIPLVVFGRSGQSTTAFTSSSVDVISWQGSGSPSYSILEIEWSDPHTGENLWPSYIGVDCRDDAHPTLVVNLQTDNAPSMAWSRFHAPAVKAGWEEDSPVDGGIGDGISTGAHGALQCDGLEDDSFVDEANLEAFVLEMPTKTITPGVWHHLILSFDLSPGCSATGTTGSEDGHLVPADGVSAVCKAWVAIDDRNYDSYDICPTWNEGGGANDVLTDLANRTATQPNGYHYDVAPGTPTYSVGSYTIPASAGSFGIPAPATYLTSIYLVEMAKMQMWTGISADTSDEATRRLFVTAAGKPAEMSIARAYYGRPVIEFDKQDQWLTGASNGSAGDFERTGTVVKYDVDPGL